MVRTTATTGADKEGRIPLNPAACAHDVTELRRLVMRNGGAQYKRQCVLCGKKTTTALPHSEVPDREIPPVDEELYSRRFEEWQAFQRTQAAQWVDGVRQDADFWMRHGAHMASAKWAGLRDRVFRRAAGKCEGCGLRAPVQVHHLSHKNMGDEFLWELQAVCMDCHRRLHPDKGL